MYTEQPIITYWLAYIGQYVQIHMVNADKNGTYYRSSAIWVYNTA